MKIMEVHFSGDFSMQPLFDIRLKVPPHVISWMAKHEDGKTMSYEYVRNSSLFVDVAIERKAGREQPSKQQKICT